MSTYEIYQVRRWMLADTDVTDKDARAALIALEVLDWKTKKKVFAGMPHLKNWIKATAEQNGITTDDLWAGIEALGRCGYVSMDTDPKAQIVLAMAGEPE